MMCDSFAPLIKQLQTQLRNIILVMQLHFTSQTWNFEHESPEWGCESPEDQIPLAHSVIQVSSLSQINFFADL